MKTVFAVTQYHKFGHDMSLFDSPGKAETYEKKVREENKEDFDSGVDYIETEQTPVY